MMYYNVMYFLGEDVENIMKTNDEYRMLREEIVCLDNKIQNLRSILYVSFTALLTIAISQDNLTLWFTPYVIIIPIYILMVEYERGIHKVAAYIIVFLEDKNRGWETRLYDLHYPARIRYRMIDSINLPFIFLDIIITVSIAANMIAVYTKVQICGVIIVNLIFILFMLFNKSAQTMKEEYVIKWKELKMN